MFVCDSCGCVDRCSVTNFYSRKASEEALCSVCDPDIGHWHGHFLRQPFDPDVHTGRIWRDGEWHAGARWERR